MTSRRRFITGSAVGALTAFLARPFQGIRKPELPGDRRIEADDIENISVAQMKRARSKAAIGQSVPFPTS